jgi:hypothetical protein
MPEDASLAPSFGDFFRALLRGLGWGIAVAAFIAAAIAVAIAPESATSRQTLDAVGWSAVIASILAIFPIGPVAGVVGWQFFKRGVVSPAVYAAVGSASALVAPLLVVFLSHQTMRYQTTTNMAVVADSVFQLALAAIAVSGAFGGFMAGRALRRRAQT